MNKKDNQYAELEMSENFNKGTVILTKEDKEMDIFEENGTFCRAGSEDFGLLEVDLQITKQKGVEVRNISFSIPLGLDENENPVKAEMFFVSEESFEKFKGFISKLNWND